MVQNKNQLSKSFQLFCNLQNVTPDKLDLFFTPFKVEPQIQIDHNSAEGIKTPCIISRETFWDIRSFSTIGISCVESSSPISIRYFDAAPEMQNDSNLWEWSVLSIRKCSKSFLCDEGATLPNWRRIDGPKRCGNRRENKERSEEKCRIVSVK